jgi:hypothetical protein
MTPQQEAIGAPVQQETQSQPPLPQLHSEKAV